MKADLKLVEGGLSQRAEELRKRKCAFYHTMKNKRSFGHFWGKRIRGEFQMRYYLLPLAANPVVGEQADCVIYGGRVTGKSWWMELDMAHAMFNRSDGRLSGFREREVILTGARDVHIAQRCEPVFDMFLARVPFWKEMVGIARRKPYELRLKNGSIFWGISVGNDPTAKNLEGPHPWRRYIEETAHFPEYAWKKFQDTAHEAGTIDTFIGVCDGRIDSPYYKIDHDQYVRYRGVQHHIPQVLNPSWNQDNKQQRVYDLKGADSDAYLQQVLAEWGSPAEGIWDLKDLRATLADLPYTEVVWTPLTLRKRPGKLLETIEGLVRDKLPGPRKPELADVVSFIPAFDPGYTQDGEIIVFGQQAGSVTAEDPIGKWQVVCRVILRNRVIFSDAAYVFHQICERYKAKHAGIDATGEQGKDIANMMMDRENTTYRWHGYTKRLHLYEGQSTVTTGHGGQDTLVRKHGKKEEGEVKQRMKDFTTTQLAGWFASARFLIPLDATDFIPAFNAESRKITMVGNQIIETPPDVHMPDVFRVFYSTWHTRFGRIDAPKKRWPIVMPRRIDSAKLRKVRL